MEVTIITIIIIFILFLVSYLLVTVYLCGRKFSDLPPTVFPTLPIIGHLYLVKPLVYRNFAKISEKHGPIVYLRLGSRHGLLVSSPSISKECFTKNDITFANRPQLLFGKIIGNNNTSLAWASYGENWRNLHRLASLEILSSHRLKEFHGIRVDECRLMIRKLLSTSSVNLKTVLYDLTLNVMMRMISGKRYFGVENLDMMEERKRFREIFDEAFFLAGAPHIGDYLPIMSWFGVKGLEKRIVALHEKLSVFLQGLIEQLRISKVENERKTVIEVLLSLQKSDPKYYTDQMIRSFVVVLLAAGTDTTAGTMEWAMSLLLNHPQILKKAQNEIDSVIGNARFIDETDLASLPYLHCIVNETLRLYPAGPLLFPRESSEDCVIGGYTIPKGTMLMVNQWAIHHDPNIWTEPERFSPDRFLGLQGSRDGFHFMPFGSGRRRCPGEGLSFRVLGMTLGSLIQCFDWERAGQEMVDMTESPGLTLAKKLPLVAKCSPRLQMKDLLSQLGVGVPFCH
uniref:cytochrome P450 81Q32-like n=1 Tax=Erigeron canadensis TaxID=72917 RepID=UPI001CB96B8C|nr:cytochrome P450 81Q32-like [Erigeron canadensis]